MISNNTYLKRIKLSNLAIIISPKKARQDNISGDIPYLNIEYLEKGICNQYVQEVPNVKENDIIIVADGYRSGMVLKGKRGWLGSTLRAIRIQTDSLISSQYLYYYLSFVTIDRNVFQYGSTIRHLNIPLLKDLDIIVPSIKRQKEICKEISLFEENYINVKNDIFKIEYLLASISYKDKKNIIKYNNSIMDILTNIWNEKLKKSFAQLL